MKLSVFHESKTTFIESTEHLEGRWSNYFKAWSNVAKVCKILLAG